MPRLAADRIHHERLPRRSARLFFSFAALPWCVWLLGADPVGSMVRKPMPPLPVELMPTEARKLEFFFVAEADESRDILALKLTFSVKNRAAGERFAALERTLRDEVYQFLIGRHPQRNALRHWQPIIQQDLTAQLNSRHPGLDLITVTVDQFERL